MKEENRKLKQGSTGAKQTADHKTPSKREMAALSTEYDLLSKQVGELKAFLKQNENSA